MGTVTQAKTVSGLAERGFVWRPYSSRRAEVLNGRRAADLSGDDIITMAGPLHADWGFAPLGYIPLMRSLEIFGHSPDSAWPVQSRWVHPSTHTLTEEEGMENSSRETHNYVFHVFQPEANSPYRARLTLAVLRKNLQRRGPGRFSPLYDPSTGITTNQPTGFTHSGEAIWSQEVSTREEFLSAAEQPLQWLTSRELCDALAALTPPYPCQ